MFSNTCLSEKRQKAVIRNVNVQKLNGSGITQLSRFSKYDKLMKYRDQYHQQHQHQQQLAYRFITKLCNNVMAVVIVTIQ